MRRCSGLGLCTGRRSAPVVKRCQAAVPLLPRCIPYLKLHGGTRVQRRGVRHECRADCDLCQTTPQMSQLLAWLRPGISVQLAESCIS